MMKKILFPFISITAAVIFCSCPAGFSFNSDYDLSILEYYKASGEAVEITGFSTGDYHALYLINGDMVAAGSNENGAFGLLEAQYISEDNMDEYDEWSNRFEDPQYVMSGVKSVTAGGQCSFIIKTDDSLWVTGSAAFGKLGTGDTENVATPVHLMDAVKAVSCGASHTLILKTDNSLWACGNNEYGQVGTGGDYGGSTPEQILTDVKAISAGYEHNLILKNDGSLWGCGRNDYGQLGMGTGMTMDQFQPVQIMTGVSFISAGYFHSLIVKTDNTLWGCGSNVDNSFSESSDSRFEAPVQLLTGVKSAYAGTRCSMVIMLDDSLRVIGNNYYGQLAHPVDIYNHDGELVSIYTESMTNVESLSVSVQYYWNTYDSAYSLIKKKDGTLWGCGNNSYGQMGTGNSIHAYDPVQIY